MFVSCSTLGGLRGNTKPEVFLLDQIRTLLRVKDAGYDTIEVSYRSMPEWVGRSVLEAIQDLNLRPYSIHLPKFLFMYSAEDFRVTMDSVFPFLEDAGVKVAVLHPPNDEQVRNESVWREWLRLILTRSEDAGVALTLELVPYLERADEFIRQQMDVHEALGMTVDLEFMHIRGLNISDLIDRFGTGIKNIHFRDSDGLLVDSEGRRKYLLPGKGQIDLCNVLRVLRESNYQGPITVEVSHRNRENIVEAKAFLDDCLSRIV
jgi:sugar phosphate isomerase/epimerase